MYELCHLCGRIWSESQLIINKDFYFNTNKSKKNEILAHNTKFGRRQICLFHVLDNWAHKHVYTNTRWWGQMCMNKKVALSNRTGRLQSNSGHCWIWRTINPAANRCLRPTAQRCAGKENCCVFVGWHFPPWKDGLLKCQFEMHPHPHPRSPSSVVTASTEETDEVMKSIWSGFDLCWPFVYFSVFYEFLNK